MNIFRNLKIGVKIIFGYLIALILMMVVGGVALVRLDQVDSAMINITKNSAQEEILAQNIVVQILLSRLYANKYINSQNPDDLARHEEEWSKLKELLTNAETSITKTEWTELLKQVKADFAAYEAAVTEIEDLIAERKHVTTDVLDGQGQQTLDLLSQLQDSIFHTYNPTAINHIANAQKAFLLMQLNVYKYLAEGDEQWTVVFDENKTQFRTALGELDTALRDMNQRKMMETSQAAAENYIAAFESLKSAYSRQNELQTNTLDVLGPQIRTTATKMSDSVRADIEAEIAATDRLVEQTRFVLIATILAATVIGLGLGFLISRGITRPLHAVTEASQQIVNVDLPTLVAALSAMAQGDLTRDMSVTAHPLSIASGDEVGVMARAFNTIIERLQEANTAFGEMTINLRQLVGQVTENAHSVGAASGQLAAAAEQAGQATGQIATTIQQVAQGTAQQIDGVSQAALVVEQVSRAIDGVAKGAQEQAVAVTQSSDITNQMAVAIQQVAANAQAGARGAATAAQTARAGSKTVEATIQGMTAIKTKVGLSVQKVQEMGQRSLEIGVIVQTIDDIASQTNLLALNAAIEAARAGEHGKGFAVVADEVRKLAEKSTMATKEIAGLIRGIQQTVTDAVAAMEAGAAEVENGAGRANEAGQALAAILEAAETVNQQVEEISAAVQQMSAASNELVGAMDSVSAVVEENTAATEEMAAGSGEITQVIDNIASISEENSAAMQEVSASAEEMNAQVEEVTASAQSLSDMAQVLLQLVAQFKLEENKAQQPEVQIPQSPPVEEIYPVWNQSSYERVHIPNGRQR